MLAPGLEPSWLPTILLPQWNPVCDHEGEVDRRQGLLRVDEQYKRPDSSCSPEGNVVVWGSRWGWGERTVVVVEQKRG